MPTRFQLRVLGAVAGLALAGCGGDGGVSWDGPPRPLPADGDLQVAEFNAYLDDVEERWEGSEASVAAEFVRLGGTQAARTAIEAASGAEGSGPATVTVTLDGLADDSIRASRYVLELRREKDGWRLERATWSQRCRPGRGHDDFSPAPCV